METTNQKQRDIIFGAAILQAIVSFTLTFFSENIDMTHVIAYPIALIIFLLPVWLILKIDILSKLVRNNFSITVLFIFWVIFISAGYSSKQDPLVVTEIAVFTLLHLIAMYSIAEEELKTTRATPSMPTPSSSPDRTEKKSTKYVESSKIEPAEIPDRMEPEKKKASQKPKSNFSFSIGSQALRRLLFGLYAGFVWGISGAVVSVVAAFLFSAPIVGMMVLIAIPVTVIGFLKGIISKQDEVNEVFGLDKKSIFEKIDRNELSFEDIKELPDDMTSEYLWRGTRYDIVTNTDRSVLLQIYIPDNRFHLLDYIGKRKQFITYRDFASIASNDVNIFDKYIGNPLKALASKGYIEPKITLEFYNFDKPEQAPVVSPLMEFKQKK